MTAVPVLVWFRHDLRLSDNPALIAAAESGQPVIAVYCLDDETGRPLGAASRWWLHHSLTALESALKAKGVPLLYRRGAADRELPTLVEETGASAVFWNRRYDKAGRDVDARIKAALKERGVEAKSSNGHLLVEPWTIKPASSEYFRVFTPFWKQARIRLEELPQPQPVPAGLSGAVTTAPALPLSALELLPVKPDWSGGLAASWTPGEAGARARLEQFLDHGLAHYADERDRPDLDRTSKLSPHLAFGEISVATVWHAARMAAERRGLGSRTLEKFLAELGWREFSYHLLFHFPELGTRNFQPRFDQFPWAEANERHLTAWQKGMTGYPIVDAGMRELWQTGAMHNRVRMIVASFLVKHLLIDWRKGEEWFWDTLVDADPASNAASWQWVAGSGADAAPYFRVFNPILQGEKFDPEGLYVRKYIPELADCPTAVIHSPWLKESGKSRNQSGGELRIYPQPIVDHAAGRERALAAFDAIKRQEHEETT